VVEPSTTATVEPLALMVYPTTAMLSVEALQVTVVAFEAGALTVTLVGADGAVVSGPGVLADAVLLGVEAL
jgi:hypothetical protein